MSEPKPRLTRDALLKLDDRPLREVEIPGLPGTVVVRQPDARTMALIAKSTADENGNQDTLEFEARLIFEGLVEPKLEPADLEWIKGLSASTFKALAREIISKKNESSTA